MGKGVRGIVYGKGINDMEHGWIRANEWNYKVYEVWKRMIQRCYDSKYHETHKTYIECYVCEHWLKLSNFVEDVVKIDGYHLWLSGLTEKRNPYQLDKDIKSNGKNKCYCLGNCCFVDSGTNTRQATKTRDNSYLHNCKGEKHPQLGELICMIDKDNKVINIKYQFQYKEDGFQSSNISTCCKFHHVNCDKEEWFKTHKKKPRKTHKGYIWKYISDVSDEQLQKYYESLN